MVNDGRATNKAVSFGTYGMMQDPAKRHGVTGHSHPQAMPTPGEPFLEALHFLLTEAFP